MFAKNSFYAKEAISNMLYMRYFKNYFILLKLVLYNNLNCYFYRLNKVRFHKCNMSSPVQAMCALFLLYTVKKLLILKYCL